MVLKRPTTLRQSVRVSDKFTNWVREQRLSSVAFPLIGCGRFGLDNKMLVLQFLDAVKLWTIGLKDDENLSVWLVIRDHAQFKSGVATAFLELLMRARRDFGRA